MLTLATILSLTLHAALPNDAFEGGKGWINTDHALTPEELRGKVVILDFWTYCCINCMHALPTLHQLEIEYAEQLVVIGVHSAKFENEKDSENIRQAVKRYGIHHPVVNDADFVIWKRFGVRAWPTLVVIDPEGNPYGALPGEPDLAAMRALLDGIIAEHRTKGTLKEGAMTWPVDAETKDAGPLSFPGKVLPDPPNDRLYIADTAHHRIVVSKLDGTILHIIGAGTPGLADGTFAAAQFNQPQGMALYGGELFVADTVNHAIRAINFETAMVRTVAGDGTQSNQRTIREGTGSALSSPWDLEVVGDTMYIAMAGTHQLWSLDPKSGAITRFAGSGRENIVDGPRLDAQLAQPSGLSFGDGQLYFADSEVSAVRRAGPAAEGTVETLIGKGLFDFGDVDGTGDAVRLQHALGVAWEAGKVYIADSYNHKIKVMDLASGAVRTLIGNGAPGDATGAAMQLHEPGGVEVAEGVLYIADTNNHRIVTHRIDTGENAVIALHRPQSEAKEWPKQNVLPGSVTLTVSVKLPEGTHPTPDAPVRVTAKGEGGVQVLDFTVAPGATSWEIPLAVNVDGAVTLSVYVPYCDTENARLCGVVMEEARLPLLADDTAPKTAAVEFVGRPLK